MAAKPGIRAALAHFRPISSISKPGDYVVHAEHGVGSSWAFARSRRAMPKGDYMLLEYAGGNKLYVPLARMDLVQRFRGEGESKPQLDRMGGATWTRTKTRIKTKMRDMAEELLKLYAQRKLAEGFAFSPTATGSASSKTPSSSPRRAIRRPPSPTSSATWKARSRWTGCCAATWVTARPKW
jgi:transcription-repair coupling factor (superfamily II helicase)